MPYPSDPTDDQWALLEPVFNAPGKRGRNHADGRAKGVVAVDVTDLPVAALVVPASTHENRANEAAGSGGAHRQRADENRGPSESPAA
ncbi:MAG: transposase [Nocardioides sp.]